MFPIELVEFVNNCNYEGQIARVGVSLLWNINDCQHTF